MRKGAKRGVRLARTIDAASRAMGMANVVNAPISQSVISRGNTARTVGGSGDRIQNEELIGKVDGSVAFATQYELQLNPGIAGTFPYLSEIAKKFEQYKVHRLRFTYVTRTSTSKPGSVMMGTEYNSGTPAPANENAMATLRGSVDGSSWTDLDHKVDLSSSAALGPRKYIRSTNVAGDPKTYDIGTFYLAVADQDDASGIGKLYVSYDVEFFNPVIASVIAQPKCYAMVQQANDIALTLNARTDINFNFVRVDSIGITNASPITIPAGTYALHFECSCILLTGTGYAEIRNEINGNLDSQLSRQDVGPRYNYLSMMFYYNSLVPFTWQPTIYFTDVSAAGVASVAGYSARGMIHCV